MRHAHEGVDTHGSGLAQDEEGTQGHGSFDGRADRGGGR